MKVVIKETKEVFEVEDLGDFYKPIYRETTKPLLNTIPRSLQKNECTPLIDKITSLDEYQKLAARTLPDLTELYPDIEGQSSANHLHMWFGIDSEIGEIIDLYKKSFAYRKKFDKVNLLEEVCDIMWYLAGEATLDNTPLSSYLDHIIYMGRLIPHGDYPTIIDMDNVIDTTREYNEGEISNELFIGRFISSQEELFRGLTNNINKLIIRYPDKFDIVQAINRDLDSERKQLEQ